MKKILYTLLFVGGLVISAKSQTGEIQGKVTDDKGAAVPFATVVIVQDEAGLKPTSKGAKTDMNGFYTIKGVAPGTYNVQARFTGKPKVVESGIVVFVGKPTTQNFKLEERSTAVGAITVKAKRLNPTKIIDVFTPVQNVVTAEQVKENTVRDVNTLASQTAGVVQTERGGDLNVGGGRSGENVYFVDGVKVTGSNAVPPSAIGNMEVITSGVPAKYGDATGGVISITTKGPSEKLSGSLEGITSQFLDPFGYNVLNAVVTGPILRRKADTTFTGALAAKQKGEAILGFFVNFQYENTYARNQRTAGQYKVKDNVIENIKANPYQLSQDGKSIISRQELITLNDIEAISADQNTSGRSLNGTVKFDLKLNKLGSNITLGGRYFNDKYNDFVERYSLLNYENNPKYDATTYSGFLRFYTPLYNPNSDKQAKKLFRNATMQIQADYEKSGTNVYSEGAGYNPWLYGYIGSFTELLKQNTERKNGQSAPYKVFYGPGENTWIGFGPHILVSNTTPYDVVYTPGNANPTAAAFMEDFVNLYRSANIGNGATSVQSLGNAGGLINGTRASNFLHGVYYPMARRFNQYQYQSNDQFRLSGNFNFDLINKKSAELNKHTIEMGFEAEKRYQSVYSISPNSVWSTAQISLNSHLSVANDKNYNPLLIMHNGAIKMRLQDYIKQINDPNAVYFSEFDTLLYDQEVSNGSQTGFSKNFRSTFGLDSLTRVNLHDYDPAKLNLNLFTPDELLSSSISPNAVGYNVYGDKLSYSTTFNDFFTDKVNGVYTRKVAPIQPVYAAGYIQDRFQLKDMAFNVGVRADYYNPVTKTLIDPYVPVGARSISEIPKGVLSNVSHPTNLDPSSSIVYVNNATNPTVVYGYRNGAQWYDRNGNELNGPESIIAASGGSIIPYLKGDNQAQRDERVITNSTFNPDLIFTDAQSHLIISPRLNFSFQIDENSLIFANFDMLATRPEANQVTAVDYYRLLGLQTSSFINNPNLKPSRNTSLGLGFKQKLSNRSALTINFLYRERTDQVGATSLLGAYPVSYFTYVNSDFSTTKSIDLTYELRRTNNLRMKAVYMMQFAEGTGSDRNSRLGLISANQGNLKVISPMNFDARHTINFEANYKFPGGSQYNGPSKLKWLFQDFGMTITTLLRSGLPYTQQSNITAASYLSSTDRAVTLGDVNSGRMPWYNQVNLNFTKDFDFKYGKKPKDSIGLDERRAGSFSLSLRINNLFNNGVTRVYRYTGSAETDGYIGSPAYQTTYATNETLLPGYGASFRDLYNLSLETPINGRGSNYAPPRIIWLSGTISF